MTQEPPGASLSEPVQEGEALSDSDDGSTAVIVAADVSVAVRSAHDPVDRFLYRCLQVLFFLIPVAMANLTGIGLGQYTWDSFDVVKLFVFRAVLLVALAVWMWVFLNSGRTIRRTRFDWLVVAVLGWVGLTTLLSIDRGISFLGKYQRNEGFVTFFFFAVLYFLSVQVLTDTARMKGVVRAACLSAVVVGAYGLLQVTSHDPFAWAAVMPFPKGMGFSTLGNPDFLGAYLTIPLVLNLSLALAERDGRWKLAHWAAELVIVAAWITAFSRGAWFGGLVGLACLAVIFVRQRHVLALADRVAIGLVGVACVGVVLAGSRSANEFANVIKRAGALFHPTQGSAGSRLDIWAVASRAILHRPLQGYGPDTFRLVFSHFKTVAYVLHNGYSVTADAAHSYPLQLASTMGIPGALLVFGLFVAVLVHAGRRMLSRSVEGAYRSLVMVGFWSAAVGYFVCMLFGISVISGASLSWLALAALASPSATERWIPRPSWGGWAAYASAGFLCLLFVANVMTVQADHYYMLANRNVMSARALPEMQTAATLSPLTPEYKQGIALVASEQYNVLIERVVAQEQAGNVDENTVQETRAALDSAVFAWQSAIGSARWEPDNYVNLANNYNSYTTVDTGYAPMAVAAATAGLAVAPVNPKLSYELGVALLNSGQPEQAKGAAQLAWSYDPNYLEPAILLATIYGREQAWSEARSVYQRILQVRPDSPDARAGLAEAQRHLASAPAKK